MRKEGIALGSVKGLPSSAETFRTHDWSSLLKYNEQPWCYGGNFKDLLPSSAGTFSTHYRSSRLEYSVPFVDYEDKAEQRPICDEDLQLPSFFMDDLCLHDAASLVLSELELLLPCMAETFERKDWFVLRKFSSMDSKLNIEEALKSELAAICIWFLFTEVSSHVKECVACILTFISFGTSKATKMSVDKMGVENLVERILTSGNQEVQRQVCLGLSILAECCYRRLFCLAVSLGAGIQDQLLQSVCNLRCNPKLTYPVLSAIASLSLSGEGMRKKILETDLLHSWLVKLLSRKDKDESILADDESILADACRTVAGIARERCDYDTWVRVKELLSHPITNAVRDKMTSARPLKGVALAAHMITKYGSSDHIDDLVKMDGLEFLLHACSIEDVELVGVSLKTIRNILRCGRANAEAANAEAANEYTEITCRSGGWDVIMSVLFRYDYMPLYYRLTNHIMDTYLSRPCTTAVCWNETR